MTTTNNNVAQTITRQIGNRAFVMWGAKNLMAGANNLSFKVGRNAAKITHVEITLNARDLYDVAFRSVRGLKVRDISDFADIDVANLVGLIERETGMYASL
ncbi:MAG TPA: hypothetical protein ENK57_14775 [Polyangiaceae bacterium]|nr:hypothetical protein [Polyangiaceae bacterium]